MKTTLLCPFFLGCTTALAFSSGSGRRIKPHSLTTFPFTSNRSSRLFSSPSSDAIIDNSNSNNNNSAIEKAQELRERARSLRLEAINAERTLRITIQQKKDAKDMEADGLIDLLLGGGAMKDLDDNGADKDIRTTTLSSASNNNIPSAQTLALRIKERGLYSANKLQKIVERLHDRETSMMLGPEGYLSKQDLSMDMTSGGGGGFVLGDTSNSVEYKQEEADRISGLLDCLLEAVQLLDDEGNGKSILGQDGDESGKSSTNLASMLRVRVADLRQSRDALVRRRVDSLTNANIDAGRDKDGIDGYVQTSISGDDVDKKNDKKRSKEEKMMARLIETPKWLPAQLTAFAATSQDEVDIKYFKMIKTDLLQDSGFSCTSWDCTDVACIFRGRLPLTTTTTNNKSLTESDKDNNKGESDNNSITDIFANIQSRLENHDELKDRVKLFLVEENEFGQRETQEKGPPPVIVALAKSVVPEQESERDIGGKSLAAFSTLLTAFTTLSYALSTYALNPTFFKAIVEENDVTAVPLCLPICVGIIAVSTLHELGHIAAAKKHGVKLGIPVPLPSLQLGTFGSITPLRSFPSTRKALFDVALSGPVISMLLSLILIIYGLSLTISSQTHALASFPVVPASMMKSSFLIGTLVGVVAPQLMLLPLSQTIPVHPLFLVGFTGLIMSAVNLLPIGVSCLPYRTHDLYVFVCLCLFTKHVLLIM